MCCWRLLLGLGHCCMGELASDVHASRRTFVTRHFVFFYKFTWFLCSSEQCKDHFNVIRPVAVEYKHELNVVKSMRSTTCIVADFYFIGLKFCC